MELERDYDDPDFFQDHPHAIDAKVDRLYRYQAILTDQVKAVPELKEKAIRRLEQLLVDQWLYHGLPAQMNDPFEGRPHFQSPNTPGTAKAQKQHLESLLKRGGARYKDRKEQIRRLMAQPEELSLKLHQSLLDTFSGQRLCCFTELGNDLLFWSHYADSHRGMCLEFDSTKEPLGVAFRVQYKEDYPKMSLPNTTVSPLRMLLTKSPDWTREKEFRSLLITDVTRHFHRLDSTGSLLHLPSDVLKGVYFGTETPDEDKELILDMIERGPFNPSIYHGELSTNSYKVVYRPH